MPVMTETPPRAVASDAVPASKHYPAWTNILRQVGQGRLNPERTIVKSREWHDLVADMITGKRR